MKIGLFIPCYVDQFYPQVGRATLELLQKAGCQVEYPLAQTCCGQPMANSGCETDALAAYAHFVDTFAPYDYIVAPSGSCTYHVRKHFNILEQTDTVKQVRQRTLDLCEFLHDVLEIKRLDSQFPHRVALHQSCHGLRGLRLGPDSERREQRPNKTSALLQMVKGLELVELQRADECCGFGGTFAVAQPDISVKMGRDRIADHEAAGAEVITAGDMSCLMHLEGIVRRQQRPLRVLHIAEILNGARL
ncbi:(Fe-S)-binding protein [Phaeodactylibacter xiamenensis]|uniref:(Fe-S)-binding protein n=1 Tax=Phaeodactylibacter xiamenensis TaxID=1524460 RepID=UPI0031F4A312